MAGADKLHLLGHEAELFRRQVIKLKNKSPVKVAISVQRPVVDISLLFVLLHTRHPAEVGIGCFFVLNKMAFIRLEYETLSINSFESNVPFNIDVTHTFSCDAGLI